MKVCLHCEAEESVSNIGIAKALTEILGTDDLREIVQYLLVFAENNPVDNSIGRQKIGD